MPMSESPTLEELVEAALALMVETHMMDPEARAETLSEWRSRSATHRAALDRAHAEWMMFGAVDEPPLSRLQRFRLAGETAYASAVDHPARTAAAFCLVVGLVLVPALTLHKIGQEPGIGITAEAIVSHQHTALHDQTARRHVTGRGEQKHVALPDGTDLWLNWNTEVLVAELNSEVHVDVLRGDALFSVSGSKDRFLVVHAGKAMVYAPQTEFTVHSHTPRDAFFQVKDGVVTITSDAEPEPTRLGPGEQSFFANGQGAAPSKASLASIAAWREGKLVFDERPLVEVLYELSHYTERPLRVGEIIDSGDRISATFALEDAEQALLQLADTYRLELVSPLPQETVVRSIDNRRL